MSQKNVILFFIGFFIFIFFLIFSFRSQKNTLSEQFLDSLTLYNSGFSEISGSGDILRIDENSSFLDKNIVYKDSLLNSIYAKISNKNDLIITTNKTKKTFTIKNGIYFFDLNDKQYDYEIKGEYFLVKPLSFGKFFIDNRNSANIKFFSFDSISNFYLTDQKNKIFYTNLYIYPHMSFSFNSSRNFYLKKADLLRISVVNKISYIQEQVFSNTQLNKEFLDKLSSGLDSQEYTFLETILTYILNQNSRSIENLKKIKDSNIKLISGLYYIQKYAMLFYNNEKKSIYYKNIILQNLKDLIVSSGVNNSLIDEILKNLENLKNISSDDYLSGVSLVNRFYREVSNNNNSKDLFAILNFQKLLYKINNIQISDSDLKLYSYLNSLYGAYDTNQFDKSFYYYLTDYIDSYLYKSMQIDLDENGNLFFKNKKLAENIEKSKTLDYFSFLLYNIIYNSLDLANIDSRDYLIELISDYIKLNNLIITTIGDDKRSLAQVYYNNDIASKVLSNFKSIFFEDTRDQNNLLRLKSGISSINFTNEQFNKLESFFKLFSFFYSKNLSLLDLNLDKDRIVDNSYKEIISTYEECIAAAKDYDSYVLKYDKTKSEILGTKTVVESETGTNKVLNRENFISYINNFNGVDISSMILSIEGDHYHVENLIISGLNFSFDLYPNSSNRIANLIVDGDKKTLSYKLDIVKENWEKLYKDATDESTRELYDFKNFFINTFIKKQETKKEIFTSTKKEFDEDKAIIILKKDKLLGEKGEFSILKNFMPINYENIFVEKNGDNYDIALKGIVFSIPFSEDNTYDSRKINVEFESNYIFSNTDHKFTNIKIKFLNDAMLQNNQKVYEFDGKSFDIYGDIDINSFQKRITSAIRRIYNKNIQ